MKHKILLLLAMTSIITAANAQKKQKEPTKGFAITAAEKGGKNWREVKFVDITTGEEVKSIYQSTQEAEPLNARTKKPIVKKDNSSNTNTVTITDTKTGTNSNTVTLLPTERKRIVNLDDELNKASGNHHPIIRVRKVYTVSDKVQTDKPFATNSAAMAYDKKHDRLYYTPMGINQLRYIDLKSNKIYYFEDEAFGLVKGYGDGPNQITRMVIASDGDGYALTNDGNHLLRFTTGKKPTITDLGPLSDDAKNEKFSIHSHSGFGGDMVADAAENLYLFTSNRNVFKISIASKVATHLGTVKGLPRGFSTNGAMVEEGSKVIVASSESTEGYFRVDLTTLMAEKASGQATVFNASDLANGNLAFSKKKKDKKDEEVVVNEVPLETIADESAKTRKPEISYDNNITVFPNPVTSGNVKVSFTDLPAGKYQVQLLDVNGQLVRTQEVTINNKIQVTDFSLPGVAKGSYLIKILSEPNKVSATSKLVVQ